MDWIFLLLVLVFQFRSLNGEKPDNCVHKNATLFYAGSTRDIESIRHTNSYADPFQQLPPINTQSKVRSMTYDPIHREILFVDESKPHQIQGIHRTVHSHVVIDQEDFKFDKIATDTITGNVYFVDGTKGIGLCSGHGNGSRCTLLIEFGRDQEVELAVHARRGLLFWLQRTNGGSLLKMANMDGNHIRQISTDGPINSISLDASTDSLYIAYVSRIARIDLNNFGQEWVSYDYASKFVYWNCNLYYLGWKYSSGYALRFYGQNHYKLIKGNAKTMDSLFLLPDEEQILDQNPCSQLTCPEICVLTEAAPQLKAKCIQKSPDRADDTENETASTYFAFSLLFLTSASSEQTVEQGESDNSTTVYVLSGIVILQIVIITFIFACTRLGPESFARISKLFGRKKINEGAFVPPNITLGF